MEPEKRLFPRPGRNRRQQKPPKAFQDWRSLLWEMEHDPELLLLTRRMEQEYQDRTAGWPRLDPERTLLFHSRHSWVCNFLTAPYFRRAVRRAFQWASERGFTTFLADYGTPSGLLALEELSDLRRSGFRFSLYAVRSVHMTQRKSYRLRRERDAQMAQQGGLAQGVYLYAVDPGGAAAAAGLQVGDVITRIDGTEIRTMTDLSAAKKSYTAGDTARFTVVRGGQSLQITVTWGAEPDPAASASQNAQGQAPGGYGPYGACSA